MNARVEPPPIDWATELYWTGMEALRPDRQTAPDEWNLRDLAGAMDAIALARQRAGLTVWQLEDRSGVSFNAAHAWRNELRYPQMFNLLAVAETLGFVVVMRQLHDPRREYPLSRIREAMAALNDARQRTGISTKELRRLSGVSLSSFYSWFRQERDPTLGRLLALAGALGFEIVMRRE